MDVPTLDKVPGYNLFIGGSKDVAVCFSPPSARFTDIESDIAFPSFVPGIGVLFGTSALILSRFISVRRPQALANCHITHILSVINWHFDDESQLIKGYKHLYIPVDDVSDENLITWFPRANRFIDEGLDPSRRADKDVALESQQDAPDQNAGKSGVLVHCAMGKSRSAAIILAYLLWDTHRRSHATSHPEANSDTAAIPPSALDVPSALALLRQGRPLAEPNDGFMEQLRLYHSMGCPDDVDAHPKYQRMLYRRSVQESLSVQRAPEVGDVRFEDEHLQDGEGDLTATDLGDRMSKSPGLALKCRKCRSLLARGNFIADHEPLDGKDAKACAHIFLHPLSWMKPVLAQGQLDGRLGCPNTKCGANIGKFAWQGMRCSCGGWVTPGFAVTRAKVDEAVVTRGKGTMDAEAGPGGGAIRLPPDMRRGVGNI